MARFACFSVACVACGESNSPIGIGGGGTTASSGASGNNQAGASGGTFGGGAGGISSAGQSGTGTSPAGNASAGSSTAGAASGGGASSGGLTAAGGSANGGINAGGTLSNGGSGANSGTGSSPQAGTSAGGAWSGGRTGAGGAGLGGNSSGGRAGSSGQTGGAASGGSTSAGSTSAGGSSGGVGGAGMAGSAGSGDRCDVAKQMSGVSPQALALTGNLGTHDPALIQAHGQYYLFHTGRGLGAKTSTNLSSWQAAPAVFSSNPAWVAQQVPGATDLWAPDISYFGGNYHLYYSASTFGSNRSCIGHATRAALNAGSWSDKGSVVCSNAGTAKDDWNAIDPNVVLDENGKAWLAFGSFWGGLKMIELDANGARANNTLHSIAARPNAGGALEAPFIVRRCGYYYLFTSFDSCCKGVDSTYKIMVGRSTSVTGPYLDRNGTAMLQGGGTLILQGGTRYKGPGHNAVLFQNDVAYNVYHSYDANNNGNSVLRVSELVWDQAGWSISGGP